jgi:hypothetical protein
MQSFQKYNVSEFLSDRHPYLDAPFTSEIDRSQVTLAVFFRKIPKLADCLNFENLPYHLRADALHTLNELVSHQESKDTMIHLKVLSSCASLLQSESPSVRKESALLIGGLVTLMSGRNLLVESHVPEAIKQKLTDSETSVRTAVAWTIKRILVARDGSDRVVETGMVPEMVKAFIQFSKSPKEENRDYLKELLEGFVSVSQYDNGILPILDTKLEQTGLIQCLIGFLNNSSSVSRPDQLLEMTLNVLSNLALNNKGKAECCKFKVIEAVGRFLKTKATNQQKKMAAATIMSITIALDGKYQAVRIEKNGQPSVLKSLYKILQGDIREIREFSIQCFHNVGQIAEGFDKSVVILSQSIKILDEVYNVSSVKPLARLLPKLSKYENPPKIDLNHLALYQRCISALQFLLNKYPKAIDEAIDTVNIAQKLGPFLDDEGGVVEETINVLSLVCKKDEHNRSILLSFIEQYKTAGLVKNLPRYSSILNS